MDPWAKDDGSKEYLAQRIGKDVPLVRYAAVKAVIMYWQRSDNVKGYFDEAVKVQQFFKKQNFETDLYAIPMINSQDEVNYFIAQEQVFLARRRNVLSAPCLLIIHYGGHGDKDDDIHHDGPGGPQKRRAVWRAYREHGPTVKWYEIQRHFLGITFDVLLLFDCCYAAQAGRGAEEVKPGQLPDRAELPGRVELLAAAGDKTETPPPSDSSFTIILVETMEKLMMRNNYVKISELHSSLVNRKVKLYTTPFYVCIHAGSLERSVLLEKLKAPGECEDSVLAWRAAVSITIGMREPLTPAILNEIGWWLHAGAPTTIVAGFKVESVLGRTADISRFIGESLPEKSGTIAQSLNISVLEQISHAWSSLQQLVTQYKAQHNVPGVAEQTDRMTLLDSDFIKRLDAANNDITHVLQKAVMMSGASSDPTTIDKALEDPASELLGMTSQLNLRRIICCQQKHNFGVKATLTRSTPKVDEERLIEEFKKYDEFRSPQDIKDMSARISQLAAVLEAEKPESFRCLQLYEWKHEQHSRQFVYHFRIPDGYKKKTLSLYDAMETLYRDSRPTLEERLTMANQIAEAVAQWHRVGWVHQSISSHNIIFLKPSSSGSMDRWDFNAPLLHGFDFARPNLKPSIGRYVENIELDIYRHPDRQGEVRDGHKMEHDLYSLGVVLLEIGLWRPCRETVEQRAKSAQKTRKSSTAKNEAGKVAKEDMVKWLTDLEQDSLAHYVGSDYRDAVRTCLTSRFGVKEDDERRSNLLDAMDKMVLQKLQRRPIT